TRRYLRRRPPSTIVTTVWDNTVPSGKFEPLWAWLLRSSGHIDRRGHGRADDSRGVLQRCGHHRRAVGQQRNPFVGLAADSAAGDEQVRPDRVLDGYQHFRHFLGPALVAPALVLLDRGRGPVLGLLARDLEVAELGVGQQYAVVDHGRADAGPEGQQHDD